MEPLFQEKSSELVVQLNVKREHDGDSQGSAISLTAIHTLLLYPGGLSVRVRMGLRYY